MTKTWTHPLTKETEEVEIGSDREKELLDKMHECGIWAEDDPGRGIKREEVEQLFRDMWKSEQERRVRMDEEYHKRQVAKTDTHDSDK